LANLIMFSSGSRYVVHNASKVNKKAEFVIKYLNSGLLFLILSRLDNNK